MAMCPEKVLDVGVSVVAHFPVVIADPHLIEQARGLDLSRCLWKLPRPGPGGVSRQSVPDPVVNGLNLAKERVTVVREDVGGTPERQMSSRFEQLRGLVGIPIWVQPVPCRRGEHQVEVSVLVPPIIERGVDNDHIGQTSQVPGRLLGQVLPQLQSDNVVTRRASGKVALPVPHPSSNKRLPDDRPASRSKSSNTRSG